LPQPDHGASLVILDDTAAEVELSPRVMIEVTIVPSQCGILDAHQTQP